MEKEFIPYEQSLELKELGFDEPCMVNHYGNKRLYVGRLYLPSSFGKGRNSEMHDDSLRDGDVTAILYQQAFRFFREKFGLISDICFDTEEDEPHYYFIIHIFKNKKWTYDDNISTHNTHKEAELECLKKLISIVKK